MEKATMNWSCKKMANEYEDKCARTDNIIQRSCVWELRRKSDFIHSLIEGYPVPALYCKKIGVDDNDKPIYDFLDGKQRITTIYEFLRNKFYLTGVRDVKLKTGEMMCLEGYDFKHLPEELQDKIKDYSLLIYYFINITDEEARIMFRKLNNGKPLSTKERNIAYCNDIENLAEIGKHVFFATSQTEKFLEKRSQIPIIMKMIEMLTKDLDDISFVSKVFNEVMVNAETTKEQRELVVNVLNKAMDVYNCLDEKEKTIKTKFAKETNFVSLTPFIKRAINEEISDNLFADFLREVFSGKKSVSDRYKELCSKDSAKTASIKGRHDELEAAWNKFFAADDEEPAADEAVAEDATETGFEVENGGEATPVSFRYGMRARGFSPMCQPKEGFVDREDCEDGKYYDILVYNRELSDEELNDYELDRL